MKTGIKQSIFNAEDENFVRNTPISQYPKPNKCQNYTLESVKKSVNNLIPLLFLLFFLIMVIVNDKYCYSIAIFFIHKFFAWAFVLCLPYSLSTIPYLIFFYSHPPLEEFSSIDLLSFCVENIVTFIFMNMFVGQIYCCEWILILHRWIVFLNFLPLTIHSKKNLILFYCF